jgi:DNA-binding CsgD family transcriptional regulator
LARETGGGASRDPYGTLTTRQREVLQLTAEGHSRVDIARRLGISSRTSEKHRAIALNKLGLRNRVELVRYALGRGILASSAGPEPGGPKPHDHHKTV